MVHSKLPILSLLCLLCALLMLPPELTLGNVRLTDPQVEKAVEFAMQQYNQDKKDSSNYFKHLRLLEGRKVIKKGAAFEYHLTVKMVKTGCKKSTGKAMTYKKIQQCKELLGNKQKPICYFKVTSHPPANEMKLEITDCEKRKIPKDVLCPGKGI